MRDAFRALLKRELPGWHVWPDDAVTISGERFRDRVIIQAHKLVAWCPTCERLHEDVAGEYIICAHRDGTREQLPIHCLTRTAQIDPVFLRANSEEALKRFLQALKQESAEELKLLDEWTRPKSRAGGAERAEQATHPEQSDPRG